MQYTILFKSFKKTIILVEYASILRLKTYDLRLILYLYLILSYQQLGFNEKFYASYSKGAWIVREKINIFYFINGDAAKALSL